MHYLFKKKTLYGSLKYFGKHRTHVSAYCNNCNCNFNPSVIRCEVTAQTEHSEGSDLALYNDQCIDVFIYKHVF
jgi:hypothetical protein